jgi:apolipoprotein D and lipocalin family protein
MYQHVKAHVRNLHFPSRINNARAVRTQAHVDLKKYLGMWRQVTASPSWFTPSDATDITASYTQTKDGIRVVNSYKKDGKREYATGLAAPSDKTNSKLEIKFSPFVTGNYWIIHTDYKTALVGTPDRKYLWILRKEGYPVSKQVINRLKLRAVYEGYDVSNIP